jgi:DNA repair exonuclease SbcCD ATPase subunit
MSVDLQEVEGVVVSSEVSVVEGKTGFPVVDLRVTDVMIQEYREKFSGLQVTTNEECGIVTKAIGVLRTTRTGIDKRRKELTENAREYVSNVNSVAKELTSQIEEIEEPLKKRKQVFEDEKQRLKQEAEEARQAKINNRMVEFLQQTGQTCSLKEAETWTDDEYVTALSNARAAYQQQIEEARKQEEERQRFEAERAEQIRQQQEEIEKQRAELERTRSEQEAALAKIRAEQQAEIDRIRAEQDEARAKHEAEMARLREEQAEADRVQREKLEAELKAANEERQRLQAIEDERQAEIFAEQEAKRIKEETEAAEALAEQQRVEREIALAELLPNIEKAVAYSNALAKAVKGVRMPLFDHKGLKVESQVIDLQDTLLKTIVERCIAIENTDENLTDGV